MNSEFYSVDDIASFLGATRGGVYQMVKRKYLPSVKIGRRVLIPRLAWEQFLAQQTENALAGMESLPHAA